jgi:hypothetical protein
MSYFKEAQYSWSIAKQGFNRWDLTREVLKAFPE